MSLEVSRDLPEPMHLTTGFEKFPFLSHTLDQIWLTPRMQTYKFIVNSISINSIYNIEY